MNMLPKTIIEDDAEFFKSVNYSITLTTKKVKNKLITSTINLNNPPQATTDLYKDLYGILNKLVGDAKNDFRFALRDCKELRRRNLKSDIERFSIFSLLIDIAFSAFLTPAGGGLAQMISASLLEGEKKKEEFRKNLNSLLFNTLNSVVYIPLTSAKTNITNDELESFFAKEDELDNLINYFENAFDQHSNFIKYDIGYASSTDDKPAPAAIIYTLCLAFDRFPGGMPRKDYYVKFIKESIIEFKSIKRLLGETGKRRHGHFSKSGNTFHNLPKRIIGPLEPPKGNNVYDIVQSLTNQGIKVNIDWKKLKHKFFSSTTIDDKFDGISYIQEVNILAERTDKPYNSLYSVNGKKVYEYGIYRAFFAISILYDNTPLFYKDMVVRVDGKPILLLIKRFQNKDLDLFKSIIENYYRFHDKWFWEYEKNVVTLMNSKILTTNYKPQFFYIAAHGKNTDMIPPLLSKVPNKISDSSHYIIG